MMIAMGRPRVRRRFGSLGHIVSGFVDLLVAGGLWLISDEWRLAFEVPARVLAVVLVLIAIVWFGAAWTARTRTARAAPERAHASPDRSPGPDR